MAKSEAFARIHREVMQVAAAIPKGRIATFADDGSLGRAKYDAWGRSQRELLEAEGVRFDASHRIIGLAKLRFAPTKRNTGVTPTPRAITPIAAKRTTRGR